MAKRNAAKKKPEYSLTKLRSVTSPKIKAASFTVDISDIRSTHSKTGFPMVTALAASPLTRVPLTEHKCWVIGKQKGVSLSKQTGVLAQCTCENYKYVWEYANAVNGAAIVVVSNGEDAAQTNPFNVVGLCKHLYALSGHIISKKL